MRKTMALVLIARDEARCIERCLRSVAPWVDTMLVLDTGSRDGTPALARAAGAAVHHFTWVDDFAAARNAALALSDADWNLVLDADEWLASGGPALQAAKLQAPFVGQLQVNSSFDRDGAVDHAPSWLSRLLPRGVRYAGRIHEQPAHSWAVRRLPVEIGHDGYRDGPMQAKAGRNLRLLDQAVADHPNDPYWHYQLGKERDLRGQAPAALQAYAQAHATAPPDAPWRHDLVLRLLFALKLARRFADALQLAEAEMPHWSHSADYFFTLGDVLLDWAASEPSRAADLLPMIEASWLQSLALGDTLDLEGAVAGRGSHLAAHNLAVLYGGWGRPSEAATYRALADSLQPAATR